jgi:DNA replication and repair protein RecF
MYIKKLKLHDFRNYKSLTVTLTKGINIIYGENAQGKTNLLESIYVLGLTKSHRSFIDNNLINNGSEYLTIEGIINTNKIDNKLNIYIDNKIKVLKFNNNTIKKVSDYISIMNIIIFYPDDLELIKGSPINRRKYLNLELSQLYSNYFILINEYNKILKLRNEYLKKINRKESLDKNYIEILTGYLIDKSIMIYKMRDKYIKKINEYCKDIFKDIMGLDGFSIRYNPSIDFNLNDSSLKEILIKEYKKKLDYDIKICSTSIGPHKDDIEFYLNDKNLKFYGSQGQQRVAVLALKLSEIEIFKKYKETTPILLLDDIFSELDDIKKNNLLKYINKDIQTIITTTDLNNLDSKLIKKSKLFNINKGQVKKIKEVKLDE